MDGVKSLASLHALILNDNEIGSVCKLGHQAERVEHSSQVHEVIRVVIRSNTRNLSFFLTKKEKKKGKKIISKNPIGSLGESLVKLKSITKLSPSNCKPLIHPWKSCLELKELRLAHNEIMFLVHLSAVPSEFGHLVKLQNLCIGNDVIANWSSLQVISSLVNLRNLNLQGNPIAEKESLLKRPIDKIVGKEVHKKVDDFSVEAANKLGLRSETNVDHSMRNKNSSKAHPLIESMDNNLNKAPERGKKYWIRKV
ncbi:hypothetical protein CDL12_02041 [Handroanthus impetiginosus]|uniref:Uncharacterized protein n=1 Tax=Handroanthus impetiginosus TaxID=429701 RepID=A0A2G9I627_9LAMI|nr:hypothetical protein CDL12_02041 [Handroanthus impetiginosus]